MNPVSIFYASAYLLMIDIQYFIDLFFPCYDSDIEPNTKNMFLFGPKLKLSIFLTFISNIVA